jgi:nucleoside-diphosphate-sugar epimerase
MPRGVLITGHNGYIGSVMGAWLVRRGYDVMGVDVEYYRDCTLVPSDVEIRSIRRDIRDVTVNDLHGVEAVIHLAALSNDPIGNLNDRWTQAINDRASVRLAELAREAGVRRFLFSSSCIMYGLSSDAVATEESELDPQTEYARSKVRAEEAIRQLASDSFSPVFLRNGTVYGRSPRMRFDTVLNDMVGQALTTGKVVVYSDGRPWRPVVNVADVARAFGAVLEAPLDAVHNQAFNTGADWLNHQVRDLAEVVVETVPGAALEVRAVPSADQRTYRASFAKFARTFPDFEFRWGIREGARQLLDDLRAVGLTVDDYRDRRFTRLAWIRHLLATGQLDDDLRWTDSAREAA